MHPSKVAGTSHAHSQAPTTLQSVPDELRSLAAEITGRVERISEQLHLPLCQSEGGDAAVHLAAAMQSRNIIEEVEDLLKHFHLDGARQSWNAKDAVAGMYAAGTGREPMALPSEVLEVLAQRDPGMLKPLAIACTGGYIVAMQQAPVMVFKLPDAGSRATIWVDEAAAGFLPLTHARMINATEFKIVTARYVAELTAAYDRAATAQRLRFGRIRTFSLEGKTGCAMPVMPALAAYMPNLQHVHLQTDGPSAQLACFLQALQPLTRLKGLRISVHTDSTSPYWQSPDDAMDLATELRRLTGLERLELGFQLNRHTWLPSGIKQLVGGQRYVEDQILYLRLWPQITNSLLNLVEARMCVLQLHTRPTAQQLKVARALDASCALMMANNGRPVAAPFPAPISAVVTTVYVELLSPNEVASVLRLLGSMVPRLTDLWIRNSWNHVSPNTTWHAVHMALSAGVVKPGCLHTSAPHGWGDGYKEMVAWCACNGVQVDDRNIFICNPC